MIAVNEAVVKRIQKHKHTHTSSHIHLCIYMQQKAYTENEAADANRRKIQVKLGSGLTICFHSRIRDDHLNTLCHCCIYIYIFGTIHHYQQHRGRPTDEPRDAPSGIAAVMWPHSHHHYLCPMSNAFAIFISTVCTPLLRGINIQYYHNCVCITRCKQQSHLKPYLRLFLSHSQWFVQLLFLVRSILSICDDLGQSIHIVIDVKLLAIYCRHRVYEHSMRRHMSWK